MEGVSKASKRGYVHWYPQDRDIVGIREERALPSQFAHRKHGCEVEESVSTHNHGQSHLSDLATCHPHRGAWAAELESGELFVLRPDSLRPTIKLLMKNPSLPIILIKSYYD